MINLITNNFVAKVICILIALGFWVYVASGESKIDNYPGSIAVIVKNTPENLVVVKDISSVDVKIIAEKGLWKKLTSNSFEAYIDLSGLSEGIHEVPIHVTSDIEGVEIIEVKPSKIIIRLEPVISKSVPVEIKIEGMAAEGMIPGEATITPEKVDISGAKFYLDQVNSAIAILKLNEESEIIEKNIILSAFNQQDKKIEDIVFNPREVKVKVPIIKGGNTKTVGIVVKTSGTPKAGFWVNEINVNPSTAVIVANSSILSKTNYLETYPININGWDADKTQKVELNLPSGINLITGSKSLVEIAIKISSASSQREILASFNYGNLAGNLQVTKIEPNEIKVLISGPTDKLPSLSSDNVKIDFDLANYNSPGTYSLDIANNMISIPEGLAKVSFTPSSIRLFLSGK